MEPNEDVVTNPAIAMGSILQPSAGPSPGCINDMVTCAYDESHMCSLGRYHQHVENCRKMYHEQQEGGVRRKKRHGKMVHCPYNITHHVPNSVLKKHIEMCEDFYKYCTDLQKDPPSMTLGLEPGTYDESMFDELESITDASETATEFNDTSDSASGDRTPVAGGSDVDHASSAGDPPSDYVSEADEESVSGPSDVDSQKDAVGGRRPTAAFVPVVRVVHADVEGKASVRVSVKGTTGSVAAREEVAKNLTEGFSDELRELVGEHDTMSVASSDYDDFRSAVGSEPYFRKLEEIVDVDEDPKWDFAGRYVDQQYELSLNNFAQCSLSSSSEDEDDYQ